MHLRSEAAAISTPGHFACGNLNFLTRRPSLGTYFALTKAQIVICPKDLLPACPFYVSGTVCLYHPIIGKLHALGPGRFCADGVFPCGPSSEAFVVTWAIHYGKLSADGFIKCPIPLTRNNRCLVANASPVSTDNALKRWKEEGAWFGTAISSLSLQISWMTPISGCVLRRKAVSMPIRIPSGS